MSFESLSSKNIKFTLDCDDFGQYSPQPLSGSSNAASIVPLPITRPTFPDIRFNIEPRKDSHDSFSSEWAYDDEDLEQGNVSESVTWQSAATAAENCQCTHSFTGESVNQQVKEKSCSDSTLLAIMMGLTFAFSFCEFGFGFANASLSLVADAFHMMSDAAALVIAIVAIRLGMRAEIDSDTHTFGWKRAEIIGALINGVYLASVCLFIILEAIMRFFKPEPLEKPWQVFWVGVAGLAINLIGVALFFSHRSLATHGGHSHSHAHAHNHEEGKSKSVNMHGVFLHVLSDAIGSFIVIATSLATIYVPYDWRVYFDPSCSIIFALLILKSCVPLIRQCTSILMQSSPKSISLAALKIKLSQIEGVESIHELHVWQMVPNYNVATVHVVARRVNRSTLTRQCNQIFCNFGIHRTTIQFE